MFTSSRDTPRRQRLRALGAILVVALVAAVAWVALVGVLWGYSWLRLSGTPIEALHDDLEPLGVSAASGPPTSTTVLVTLTTPVDPTVPRPPELVAPPALVQFGGPRQDPAVLLLPTELPVTVDGHGELPIDEIQREGGSELMVRTIVDYTEVEIDHVVSFSVDALPRMAEVFDDLEVCEPSGCWEATPERIRLELSGTDEERLVAVMLATLRAMGERVDTPWVFRSPLAAKRLIDAVADEILTDVSLRGTTLLGLSDAFAATHDLDVEVVPVLRQPWDGALLVLEEPAAVRFQQLREGTPFTGDVTADAEADLLAGVEVAVLNAAGIDGLAGSVSVRLSAAGFAVVGVGNAPRFDRDTTAVTFVAGDPEVEYAATLLAEELGGATLEPLDVPPVFEDAEVDVLVLAGADAAQVQP